MKPILFVASDHAALVLKNRLIALLSEVEWRDLGPQSASSVDYPDYAQKLCQEVLKNPGALGVLLCGSGIGMSIAANKIHGIRAACVENPVSARLAREHNDAQILCMGARFVAPEYAAEITKSFLFAQFEGGRHQARIDKINTLTSAKS
jgi:ribose 5-phosphate isomerase B